MAEAIFDNLFQANTGVVAGPSSIDISTPGPSIGSSLVIDIGSAKNFTEQLTSGVDGLTMEGSVDADNSGLVSKDGDGDEVVDYE